MTRFPRLLDVVFPEDPRRVRLFLAVLVLLHAALLLHTAWRKTATVDEVAHLPAGITYWQTGTFAVYHHNPPLVKLLAALPVLAAGGTVDYSKSWARSRERGLPVSQWNLGWEFMYANAPRYRTLYFLGRLVPITLSCIGLLLVGALAWRIAGPRAAVPAAWLWCFSPNVLAHGCLITTDVPAAVMAVATVLGAIRWAETGRWRHLVWLGVLLGLAQLTKFSLLLLFLVVPVVIPFANPSALWRSVRQFPIACLVAVAVINAGYFFEGTGKRLGDFTFLSDLLTVPRVTAPAAGEVPPGHPWAFVLETRVNRFRETILGALPVPLPEHYLLGFDEQRLEAEGIPGPDGRLHGYPVYLCGELRDHGWWYYYLVALGLKLPLGSLGLLLGWCVAVAMARTTFDRLQFLPLCVAALFLGIMSLATDINLGLRYVLPAVPFLFVLMASVATVSSRLPLRALVALAFVWNALAVARIHPHYLAYFNELAGGATQGHRYLIDSNIDWGQDLYELAEWLEQNRPGQPVGLAYFGNVDPAILKELGFHISYYLAPPRTPEDLQLVVVAPDSPLRSFLLQWATQNGAELSRWQEENPGRSPFDMPSLKRAILKELAVPEPATPGLYAVSVNFLRRLPFRLRDQQSNIWDFARHPDGTRGDPYSYFLEHEPIARIGYSIYVFEIR